MKKKKADGGSPSAEDPLEPEEEHMLRQLMGSMGTAHSSTQTTLSVAITRLSSIKPKGSVEIMLAIGDVNH